MIQIGEPITKEQKQLFQRVLTIQDVMDVAASTKVSYSAVRNLYYRNVTVTEHNKIAAQGLVNKAFEKVEDALSYFLKAKSELETMLPTINA